GGRRARSGLEGGRGEPCAGKAPEYAARRHAPRLPGAAGRDRSGCADRLTRDTGSMLASRTWPVAALTATLLAVGCDDKKRASSCSPLANTSTASQSGGHAGQTMFLTDVQAKGDRCVDRITFSFRRQGPA